MMRSAVQSLVRVKKLCRSPNNHRCLQTAFFSSEMEKKQAGSEDEYDVVIVGGGMVGAAVGCGLACSPLSRDLRVAIIDSSKPMAAPKHDPKAVPDQRVSAITPATVRFFKEVGAWESVQAAMPTPFDAMQVWDYEGLGYTRYTADDVGAYVLGYVVENKVLLGALRSRIEDPLILSVQHR